VVQREIEGLESSLNPDPRSRTVHLRHKLAELQRELAAVERGELVVLQGAEAAERIREVYRPGDSEDRSGIRGSSFLPLHEFGWPPPESIAQCSRRAAPASSARAMLVKRSRSSGETSVTHQIWRVVDMVQRPARTS
jgi:hypothetical protein